MKGFNVYNEQLERIAEITVFESAVMEEKYNDVGKLMIESKDIEFVKSNLEIGNYISRSGSKNIFRICSRQIESGKAVVNGFSAVKILDFRASDKEIKNTNAEAALLSLVGDMSAWDNLIAGKPKGLQDVFENATSDGSVLKYCQTIAEAVDMGFKISLQDKKLVFECYKPVDSGNIVFAEKFGNLTKQVLSESDIDFRNVAIVAGAKDDKTGKRTTVISGDTAAAGDARREMYVDARDLQPEEGEKPEAYNARLVERGKKKLAEQVKIENITCEVDPADYGKLYEIGDISTCILSKIGVKLKLRITGAKTTINKGSEKVSLSFGDPIKRRG